MSKEEFEKLVQLLEEIKILLNKTQVTSPCTYPIYYPTYYPTYYFLCPACGQYHK